MHGSWFNRFCRRNFDLKNEPQGNPATKVNNEELKVMEEADPYQTTKNLRAWFDVNLSIQIYMQHKLKLL